MMIRRKNAAQATPFGTAWVEVVGGDHLAIPMTGIAMLEGRCFITGEVALDRLLHCTGHIVTRGSDNSLIHDRVQAPFDLEPGVVLFNVHMAATGDPT